MDDIWKDAVTEDVPSRVYVDVPEARIKTDPTVWGTVSATVKAGTVLVAFDRENDFYLVKTPDGTLGWIYDDNVIATGD